MAGVDTLEFRNLRSVEEVQAARVFEEGGYTSDEGASLESMRYRFDHAAHLFLGAFDQKGALVGYVMSTQADAPLVTHRSMEEHDPRGSTVCIHSVCVNPLWQRKGVASRLLEAYTSSICKYNSSLDPSGYKIKRLALLSRENLIPLYERAGYTTLGKSSVVHGTETWYDCIMDL
ncbi:hypothetical protein H4R20_000991 [Coemansia guatemalensis]|uniref:N-acetyltransferase domain-containing protein n=1 Tax=Coemansia guatemalensis TaxID=2761395 RepID=A0A9W8LWE4_9FUNG|nr:hypothetical protein H4R20_000991 [Coemansia guatemalensis]